MTDKKTWSKAKEDKEDKDRTDYYAGRTDREEHSHSVIRHDPDTGRNTLTYDRDEKGNTFTSDRRGESADIPPAVEKD